MSPYLITSLLFLSVGILAAVDSSLTHLQLLPWFNGLRWLRVHLITLGVVSQTVFGIAPILAARRAGLPQPATRLDIWLTLTSGTLVLIAGIPLVNQGLILAGGTLVFAATVMLLHQLWDLRGHGEAAQHLSRRFYIAGAAFFLLGIIVGTGLWLGWNTVLRMAAPIEVHIHANSWGFLSLVFAGILIDQYPRFADRDVAWPGSIKWIYWLMLVGAVALVMGPWLAMTAITAPGMIMYLVGTIWLLLNFWLPLKRGGVKWTPGLVHIFAAYLWIIAPLLFAPFIILGVENFPVDAVEGNAPQALIYGWALQLSFALFPFLYARYAAGSETAKLGGTWFSVVAVNVGSLLLFTGIFMEPQRAMLHGAAYLAWAAAMVPILVDLWRTGRSVVDE